MLQDSVQRDDHGHSQCADEIEDVAAVLAAEYAVLVLDADEAQVAEVDVLRRTDVVGFDVLPDFELDLVGVLVLPRRFRHGQHYRRCTMVVAIDRKSEVCGEGGDSAAARAVGADESDRRSRH